ncbi:MAG: TonB-dependent receptor plug domain-containing protein, partial [Pseudomonadales bacterium]
MRFPGFWSLALAVGCAAAPMLTAHAAAAAGIEELLVTAEKREQRLQDIPASLAGFTGESLEALGLHRSAGLAAQAPNVIVGYPQGGSGMPAAFIRGVGLHDFGVLNQPPVASYVDGVYLAAAQSFPLLDVERVEILRGPQGALYGRNAMGGVVNVVSRQPGDTWEGWARAGIGTFGATELAGAVGGLQTWMRVFSPFRIEGRP